MDDLKGETSHTPPASSANALRRMQTQRQSKTRPELELVNALEAAGFRVETNQRVVAGVRRSADCVLRAQLVAVFVDGCFWHCCPQHATWPKANAEFWRPKLRGNVERDRNTDAAFAANGWTVIRVWEHEPVADAVERVVRAAQGES